MIRTGLYTAIKAKIYDESLRGFLPGGSFCFYRISELDGIFKRIYEDNISGKLSDERFAKLSADYEREQKQLISDTEILGNELNQEAEQVDNVEYFLSIVRRYTEIKELSARVVNEFD